MGINSENNNENLKQQEAMANAIDGATAGAQQFANATEAAGKAGKKMTGSLSEITEGIDDFTEGLDKALKSIHLLPGAIEEYTKVANKNMAYAAEKYQESFVKGLFNEKLWAVRAELGRETEELKIAMEQAKKSMEQAEASNDEYEKHTAQLRYKQLETAYTARKEMKVSQQLNKKLAYDMKTELLKIGKQMFSDLWSYAKKILDEAYTKDKSTIEQNYGTIMSYNSYNHGEYAKLIDRLQEKIDASGLGDVISINTLQENLTKTMQSGLQGALAESNAYYASIAEKAGITFDWYGSEWTTLISQMNRTGKDYEKVMKSVISTTDDLAEIYGDSKGLSEGRANQMMAAASSLGTTYGLSEDAIGNIYKSLAVTSQELTNYGIDTNNFVQDITGALQSGLSNPDLGVIFGTGGATGDQVEQKIKEGKFDELILQYMNNLEDMYKGQNTEMVNALQGALGSSFSTTDYQAFQTYWEQEGSFSTNFEKAIGKSTSSVEDIEGELKDYVTTQESYETRMENYLADIAEVMVQNPILEVISKTLQSGFATIGGILIGWGGKQLLNKFLSSSGSSGGANSLLNLGKSLFSSKGTGAAANAAQPYSGQALANFGGTAAKAGGLSKLGSLFTNGTAFASKGGSLAKIGSTVFSTGGKALGVAGSLISMGINGYQGYQEDGWAGAARGAITGSGKAAESGWDVAKGTGSAALKGAGIGMVFGPWGAAIGAAVGAVAGLTTTIIDYNNEQSRANRAMKATDEALSKLADQAKTLNSAQADFKDTIKLTTEASKGSASAEEALMAKYPQYQATLGNLDKESEEYKNILSKIVAMEARKLAKTTGEGFTEATSDVKTKEVNAMSSNDQKNLSNALIGSQLDLAMGSISSPDIIATKDDSVVFDSEGNLTYAKVTGTKTNHDGSKTKTYGERITLNTEDYRQKLIDAGINAKSFTSKEVWAAAEKIGLIDVNRRTKIDALDSKYNSADYASIQSNLQDNFNAVSTISAELGAYYNNFTTWNDLKANGGLTQKALDTAFAYYNYLYSFGTGSAEEKTIFEQALGMSWEDYLKSFPKSSDGKDIITPKSLYTKFNDAAGFSVKPKFAVGTDYVPYDNYLALLHRGEQVKTSAEVALEEANKHIASSTTSKAIHDVVLNQTNTIISILTNIYEVLAGSSKSPVPKAGTIKYDLPGI